MSSIEPLVAQIKQATEYQVNKRILKEKIQTDLHFAFNGGMFKITPSLLSFVQTWPMDFLYIEDVYENPIEVERQVFLVQAQQHYHKVMNTWHQQHAELKRIRRV